jgi:hypothetical protein
MRRAWWLLACSGCGLGVVESGSGGGDNLPTLGAGPYGRLQTDFATPADEPYVVASRFDTYRDPAALPRDDGGLRVWFTARADADPPDADHIGYAELPSVRDLPDGPPTAAFVAELAWEEGRVAAPAVIRDGDTLVMFYTGSAASIGRALSTDDGATWTRDAAPVLEGARDPSAVLVDGTWHLFFTRPDAPGIWRARGDGASFTVDDAPVVVPRPEDGAAFDRLAVLAPFATIDTSDAGRPHWHLWFEGARPGAGGAEEHAVGYAGSFDGNRWERFGGPDPVLTAPAAGPCVLLDGPTSLMLFHEEQQLHLGVAAAVHP